MADELRVKTKDLHPAVQKLIKDLREGMGARSLEKVREAIRREQSRDSGGDLRDTAPLPKTLFEAYAKCKRYAPREVRVRFCPGPNVKVNVAAFSFNAVNGHELSRGEQETWMGSDGEPNYDQQVTYAGPVVLVSGYGKKLTVELLLPTGLSDEGAVVMDNNANWWLDAPHRLCVKQLHQIFKTGDVRGAIHGLVDLALEGSPFPYREESKSEEAHAS